MNIKLLQNNRVTKTILYVFLFIGITLPLLTPTRVNAGPFDFDIGGFDFDLGDLGLPGFPSGSTGSTGSTAGSTGSSISTTGPCALGLPALSSASPTSLGVSSGAGSWVPVRDIKAQNLLIKLGEILNKIEANTAVLEGHVPQINFYLTRICEKEFEYDKDLQHAWAGLIGQFVEQTRFYVTNGLNENALYLENQTAYYQLVDLATARVFMQDIVDSNIGEDTKRLIVQSITAGLLETRFPYDVAKTGPTLAPDELPINLSLDYYEAGSFTELANLFFNHESGELSFIGDAILDFENRRTKQLEYEREKLGWGRGFFSHEICDLSIYERTSSIIVPTEADRRNCRISTPGALIQDETSFVFGSALRQMELADEYEEWVAPNTLAVLSDILSYRTLNNPAGESRGPGLYSETPTDSVTIITELEDLGGRGIQSIPASDYGNIPVEFNVDLDWDLWVGGGFGDLSNVGSGVFHDFLNPDEFLDQI